MLKNHYSLYVRTPNETEMEKFYIHTLQVKNNLNAGITTSQY